MPLPLIARPGLAHPPPGLGDGLRDNDMEPVGVPGIVARACPLRGDRSESLTAPWRFKLCGTCTLDAEDRRRR
jgi:hypothetical protein